jgi:outer membrane protein OmpA-like peptidoglycan-associated protein
MKSPVFYGNARTVLIAAAVAAITAGCATVPEAPPGSVALRSKLSLLQSESALAAQIPVMLTQADTAVTLAETPVRDPGLTAHRIYLADHLIDTARATAETRLAEQQRPDLRRQSEQERLAARTREADAARGDAAVAQRDAAAARTEARDARSDAANARSASDAAAAAAALSEAQRLELAQQITLLQGRTTDRGIVLTLGDVLFETNRDNLKPGAIDNLDRLITFMQRYADRSASIEGHTDSMGTDDYNQNLSERRAEKSYLTVHGLSSARLTSVGKGEGSPVAGNGTAAERQQNRRVEIVIENTPATASAAR